MADIAGISKVINAAAAAGVTVTGENPVDVLAQVVGNITSGAGTVPVSGSSGTFTGAVTGASMNGITQTSGAASSVARLTKSLTGLADNTATDALTITVPNAKHSARIRVSILGQLGAGGAIGAGEAAHAITYDFVIVRTAGVNAVGLISTAYGSATQKVAGADTCTVVGALSSVAGAVGAVNTFTITVKVTKGAGASDNHTALLFVETLNTAASGITVA